VSLLDRRRAVPDSTVKNAIVFDGKLLDTYKLAGYCAIKNDGTKYEALSLAHLRGRQLGVG
jgi:hypothetical protein